MISFNLIKRASATLFMSMLCLIVLAQERQVAGTVVDQNGQPVIGAFVMVDGTTNGVVTDVNGNYKLPNVPQNAVIKVSFKGLLHRRDS